MPRPSPTSPTCLCGYDLSGLPGPPWTCPECALVAAVWPPLPRPRPLSAGEGLACAVVLVIILCFSLLVPWAAHDLKPSHLTPSVALLPVLICALAIALVRSRVQSPQTSASRTRIRTLTFLAAVMATIAIAMVVVTFA